MIVSGDIETPLHPSARKAKRVRLVGEAYIRMGFDLSQVNSSFFELGERALIVRMSLAQLNKPPSLITLSGV